jgi:aconitase A
VYFSRLNTNNINPLVAEALKVNTNLHEEDIYSWYTFANNIFKEFDLNIENYSNIDKSFEKVKCSIKTQLRKVVTESIKINLKKIFHHNLTNQNHFYIVD